MEKINLKYTDIESKIRVLHAFLPEALSNPELGYLYATFLRDIRERIHPIGKQDLRMVWISDTIELQVDVGDRLGCDFFYGYNAELFDCNLFIDCLSPGEIVIDIGANFGYYTLLSAEKVEATGKIHSFEPDRNAYNLLEHNCTHNNYLDRVALYPYCVSSHDGQEVFYECNESSFSGIHKTGRASIKKQLNVQCKTIDVFVEEKKISGIDALKIDVEGNEFRVLKGARATLKKEKDILIMIEVCQKNLDDSLRSELLKELKYLEQNGMSFWEVCNKKDELKRFENASDVLFINSGNIFITHKGSKKEKRLNEVYSGLVKKINRIGLNVRDEGQAKNNESVCGLYDRDDIILFREYYKKIMRKQEEYKEALEKEIKRRDGDITALKNQILEIKNHIILRDKEIMRQRSRVERYKDNVMNRNAEILKLREEVQSAKAEKKQHDKQETIISEKKSDEE